MMEVQSEEQIHKFDGYLTPNTHGQDFYQSGKFPVLCCGICAFKDAPPTSHPHTPECQQWQLIKSMACTYTQEVIRLSECPSLAC